MTTESHLPAKQGKNKAGQNEVSFAEMALKLGGKSDEEARRTGVIDTADDQVEALFAAKYQTTSSPAHRAVWDREFPVEAFSSETPIVPADIQQVMDRSLDVVRKHLNAKTLKDEKGKIPENVFAELAEAGYWGLLVAKEFGGSGASFSAFAPFVTKMATLDSTIAGLASVHGCIGAVDPVRTFGTAEQKQRFLPGLANGTRLSAFALTEPCAGSDLSALRTTAALDGNDYVVNGEKLFITNILPGRTVGLVVLIDNKPAVLIADLPPDENESFQFVDYGLWALKHTYNRGMIFKNFRVPKENLLTPPRGDGLTIAYHGLNLGRVALCATAAGTMRTMLTSMIPWANYRKTYGAPIANRELVQRRLGRLAALIVGSDALVAWCASLIDQGYRGEMECTIAKVFGSEAQKEAAIELLMKTHGGRSFLHGHPFGENIHEYLAPCIYEGEGEILSLGFFKTLVKNHGKTYFEPIGKALAAKGIKNPNPLNPAHAWALRTVALPYLKWRAGRKFSVSSNIALPEIPTALKAHAQFACNHLQNMALEISQTMSKFQLQLSDRQCRMSELSVRAQSLMTILCTSLYGARHDEPLVQEAADVLCQDLTRAYTGKRPSNAYFEQVTKLGNLLAQNPSNDYFASERTEEIMMPYREA